LESTLGDCAAAAVAAGIEPPALVVIGEVVRLRGGLDWLGALAGRALVADPLGVKSRVKAG
jgi:uroporphyrin-III C-methyltransferase